MSNIPTELYYTNSHEWVRDEGDGTVTIGITDYAQAQLGDLVFVELPEVDGELAEGDECGVVESVKAASDLYSPIAGVVLEVNEALSDAPDLINQSPYEDGWIAKVRLTGDLDDLLSSDDYAAVVEAESE